MDIPSSEFILSFSRSSGAGGQNVNKVNTKVTLSWDIDKSTSINGFIKKRFKEKYSQFFTADGLVKIVSQKYRTQPRNITDCMNKLIDMVKTVEKPPKRRIDTKPTKSSIKKRITNKKNKGQIKKDRKKVSF